MQTILIALALLLLDSSPVATGKASYYAHAFAGRRTASGERYRPADFTAAHRSFPFGTLLLVTRLDTNDSVIVRVNDRGPFVRGRIVDLSRAAADRLDMVRAGTCRVSVRRIQESSVLTDSATEAIFPEVFTSDTPAIAVVSWPSGESLR